MTAGTYQMEIEQGADYSRVFTLRDSSSALVSLVGATCSWPIKDRDSGTLICTPNVALGGTSGTLTVTIAKAITATMAPSRLVYNALVTYSGGTTDKWLEGPVVIFPQV